MAASTTLLSMNSVILPASITSNSPSDITTRDRAGAIYQSNVPENSQSSTPNSTLAGRVHAPSTTPTDPARMERVINTLYSA